MGILVVPWKEKKLIRLSGNKQKKRKVMKFSEGFRIIKWDRKRKRIKKGLKKRPDRSKKVRRIKGTRQANSQSSSNFKHKKRRNEKRSKKIGKKKAHVLVFSKKKKRKQEVKKVKRWPIFFVKRPIYEKNEKIGSKRNGLISLWTGPKKKKLFTVSPKMGYVRHLFYSIQ